MLEVITPSRIPTHTFIHIHTHVHIQICSFRVSKDHVGSHYFHKVTLKTSGRVEVWDQYYYYYYYYHYYYHHHSLYTHRYGTNEEYRWNEEKCGKD